MAEVGHAEMGRRVPGGELLKLGKFLLCAGEADLEALDLAEPAFALGFGDSVHQIVADLHEPRLLGGVGARE